MKQTYRDDIFRRERLNAQGWQILYATADDLRRPQFLIIRLRKLLASTGKTL